MTATTEPLTELKCFKCQKPAKLQCPKCLELDLERDHAAFCSQQCFAASWVDHKRLHRPGPDGWHYATRRGAGRSLTMPDFNWTGPLRPWRISPMRSIPDSIPKPEWYSTGRADVEVSSRQQHTPIPRFGKAAEGIRAACTLGRKVLDLAHAAVAPGVTTDEIDRVVHEATIAAGAYPSPYNYFNFPKSVCTSVNEIICHGIPDRRPLENGDIVNVDVSVYLNGWHGDLNETFVVGEVDDVSKKLLKTTHECLELAIAACRPGMRYRDVGDIITRHASAAGLSVVKAYCGHGIGDLFHCAPNVHHYAHNKARGVMKEGEVFTIEPMICVGSHRDKTWPDGWTAATEDGLRSAQFEHQLLITPQGCEVLTARLPTSPPLWWEVEDASLAAKTGQVLSV
ncbi:Methionine aminopeptidase 1A [Auxenochlorella protothecoides]|uniref:Methionine aminopeptidase n=1 Tax=Auxenochlorella protothecoides TaxID=3075 RepID=A0A087SEV9_AUXPR|nr:Methionine aminopeptidase 1A [Auxenochlorella protothecoides]KFM24263.1 Methionine aminopeptidase 1A [Auxenochlorella protothecoides]RMZ56214.1 hypothetical protein APUTEX25_002404 [Auxenochlorella protothecoides]|eukprot:RMZ56214.1 hypothetical protein APUTEX25_002404 [Auxenochlorella protothecoides]